MQDAIFEKQGVKIFIDEASTSPRVDRDNLGKMVCFHGRYNLGDSGHGYSQNDYSGWGELQEAIEKDHGPCTILPIYMYDHSGLTIRTHPFGCPWDSGQIGFTYVSDKQAEKEGVKDPAAALKSEVEEYDQYLRGAVYGFVRTRDRFYVHTCPESGRVFVVENGRDNNLCEVFARGGTEAAMVVDALNEAHPDEDSCWGFYGYEPEELAEAVLKGEV